jgi:hypothetical protein
VTYLGLALPTPPGALRDAQHRAEPRSRHPRLAADYLEVEGTAHIVSLPEAMEGLVAYYRAASGEHEDGDDYRRAMQRDKRCLIRIRIERVGPDGQG